MAGSGAGRANRRGGRPARPGSGRTSGAPAGAAKKPPQKRTAPPPPPVEPHGTFRLGAIEGATPGTWIDRWRERMPRVAVDLVPLGIADQREAVASASVDAALVRLPLDRAGLHVIELYDEVPVVVCAADSHLTAADELTLDDLDGEVVIAPQHPPVELAVPGALVPRFAAPESVGEAIAIAASGVGVVIVPMSLARLHHRKDATFRPLVGGPVSTVALAWPVSADGDNGALVDAFIGIVRGRTANSSR
ncbi:LysR substrate-binding domain-containing protein [Microbacterium hominis]|uniref:LysR substrate-binding domain-containing protein n=1 Tax=Microbacterium hominis TaxID=162426 RepID=UPI0007687D75|nr:LysR substrate-binding domain-containing protein [Microbacterium hominis]KXC07348.1 transcriptional regulator [Microbacterium hominis]